MKLLKSNSYFLVKQLQPEASLWLQRIWALFWILLCELAEQNSKRSPNLQQLKWHLWIKLHNSTHKQRCNVSKGTPYFLEIVFFFSWNHKIWEYEGESQHFRKLSTVGKRVIIQPNQFIHGVMPTTSQWSVNLALVLFAKVNISIVCVTKVI